MTKEDHSFYVYIMTSYTNTVLYVGMTNNILRRANEHKNKVNESFTKRYNCTKLVYVEVFDKPWKAIAREKQLKAGSRRKKLELIHKENPGMRDILKKLQG